MPCGVIVKARVGRAVAAAALVEHDDSVHGRVEKAAQTGRRAAAGTSVNDNDRFAHRVAALLVIHCVNIGDLERASAVRVDVGEQLQAICSGLHHSARGASCG